ncbi:MAG: L,D-transpeptidase [Clostridia bacterium]|nr:L,D-transpeptidase [Clostridia bacterium]
MKKRSAVTVLLILFCTMLTGCEMSIFKPISIPTPTPIAVPTPTPTPIPTPTPVPGPPYKISVSVDRQITVVFAKDGNGEFTIPVRVMTCSSGTNTTFSNNYKIINKYEWRSLRGNVYGQYATRYYKMYLFHSVPYARKSKDALLAEEYNKLGTIASRGCIRLTVADAKWIYDNCPMGTKVEVLRSPQWPVEIPAPTPALQLPLEVNWDPTDPDPENPYTHLLIKSR